MLQFVMYYIIIHYIINHYIPHQELHQKIMEKLKAIKSAANYMLNPLASLRNPVTSGDRIKKQLGERPAQEKIPYSELGSAYSIDSKIIDLQCRRLRTISYISFCGASLILASSICIVILYGALNELTLATRAQAFITFLFSFVFFSLSVKYAFLANGIENNLDFEYANPLGYIKHNLKVYLRWVLSSEYKTQCHFKEQIERKSA